MGNEEDQQIEHLRLDLDRLAAALELEQIRIYLVFTKPIDQTTPQQLPSMDPERDSLKTKRIQTGGLAGRRPVNKG
mgnify:CR=1 FL=1